MRNPVISMVGINGQSYNCTNSPTVQCRNNPTYYCLISVHIFVHQGRSLVYNLADLIKHENYIKVK